MDGQKNEQLPQARDPRELVDILIEEGQKLSPDVRDEILVLRTAAVPSLIEILEDEYLQMMDAPGEGWAPIHAAELLSELGALEAIQPMINCLVSTEWECILHDRLLSVLRPFGEPALEPLLEAYENTEDLEIRKSLCSVLAGLGIQDERIFRLLLEELEEEVDLGAMHLADYGDSQALPYLQQAFDTYEVVEIGHLLANHAVIELRAAIEELGGQLTESQVQKYDQAIAFDERSRRQLAPFLRENQEPVRSRKLGRNEPCWCGSGKKYKKCHLAADRASHS